MSVEEYTSQFSELRRYAPHQDERDMAMRYISGLSYRIRIHVVSLCCETVDRAIAAAMSVEAERESCSGLSIRRKAAKENHRCCPEVV